MGGGWCISQLPEKVSSSLKNTERKKLSLELVNFSQPVQGRRLDISPLQSEVRNSHSLNLTHMSGPVNSVLSALFSLFVKLEKFYMKTS